MTAGLEFREVGDGTVEFTGYACRTGVAYDFRDYVETVAPGAFRRTLQESPDVVLLVNHEGVPLARTSASTLALEEDQHGLRVEAQLDAGDPEVQSLRRKYERGDLNGEMSFAFKVNDQSWSEDHRNRVIRSVGLHKGDVSIVTFGANDATTSVLREADLTLEKRVKRAELLGDMVSGVRGGHIVAFGGVTRVAPVARRSPLVLPDYTSSARAWLDLERAKMDLAEARERARR